MKNIKKILVTLLFGLLSLTSLAANFGDTDKAKSGQEFMQIFMANTEYEPRYQNWMSEVKKLSPEEKVKGDSEAKALIENNGTGEVQFKSKSGLLLMTSKIDKGQLVSMSMYDKDGVITKINTGEIIIYYKNGKKAVVTKSPEINPAAGRLGVTPSNGIGELYYENGQKAGETTSDDRVVFYHKNGKPFIENKKGWEKEKIYK